MNRQLTVLAIFFSCAALLSTGCGRKQENTTVNIISEKDYAKGLSLVALGELVKKSSDAKTLEEELNKPNSINNLDLNEDDKVDYLKVTEYGKDNVRGLSITDEVAPGETQEIATIEISKSEQKADMAIAGNNTIYRDPGSMHYHSSFGLTDMLILGYLFSPRHTYWASPYGYGAYPRNYQPYGVSPHNSYANRVATYSKDSKFAAAPAPAGRASMSPNAGKTSSTFQRKITEARNSAKAYQSRNAGKKVGTGGFGRKKYSTPSSPSRRSPFRSRGFGRRR